jgi:hypothetical protein
MTDFPKLSRQLSGFPVQTVAQFERINTAKP